MAEPVPESPLEQTLRQAAAGDAGAWRRLVEAYTRRVFGLLLRQCGDRDLAEELTQATFVKVAATLGEGEGYEERGRFEAWLFRIALNGLRDEMRRRGRQARVMDMSSGGLAGHGEAGESREGLVLPDGGAEDPAEVMGRREMVEQLRLAVAELSEPEQRVLHLRHTAGLSFAQIAETLGEPLGTVLARGHRALGKLRKKLASADADVDVEP
ncbi:MAG: RNA polymerase sigma factor [Phycisphaeraceae bacterium]